ncbi:hypothetical protein NLJ89_g771 [Agrocybe chaxingu]|uniref:Uncharacterized protein n=1 Tax=Agrocybe chaxingu TaxID=84603 RepID=A0A9W8N184_9AGAR|nr:hypothetical protein NLJ89_g771 [Agrocybe chaxingu]
MLHNTVQGCSITPVPPPPTIRHEGTTQPGEDFSSSSSIPSPIPPELQALIDAYIFGRPVTIIISKDRLLAHWSLQLPKICEYAVLGFFSILGVEETKLEVGDPNGSGKAKQVGTYGQVRWRFRLRWAPGGERSIFPKVDKAQLERPWWDPAPLRPRKPDDKPLPSAPPSEDNFPTTLRYRDPSFKPYALELLLLRDPQDRLPVSLPYNTYPKPMEVTKAKFEGGIQTLSYYLKKKSKRPFIKHIFTANLPKLQLLANRILHDIQVGLRICRKAGDNGPYFTYSAQCPSGIMHPNDQDWEKPPSIINVVKNMMVQRARCFAEVDKSRLRINHFEMLAWVTSGTKKSTVPIRAKQRPVVLVSLGADIVLTVLPLSMKDSATLAVQPNDQPVNELAENIGWIGTNPEKDGVGENDETAEIPKEKGKGTGKRKYADQSFVFTLVHGDALVFDGDEFEYSIKREGTSFLLMGSCKDDQ